MSVRILGGRAKGFSLAVPPESITRPTSVMLKRRLFDAHQDLSGYQFIDACAGSGNVGLEAWSRGADYVCLVESNLKALRVLDSNVRNWKHRFKQETEERTISVYKKDILKWWREVGRRRVTEFEGPTILYLDPPYANKNLYRDLAACLSRDQFSYGGAWWIQSDEQKGISQAEVANLFATHKIYRQGQNFIAVHQF